MSAPFALPVLIEADDNMLFANGGYPVCEISFANEKERAYIVKAINCHDELVSLLKELVDIEGAQPGTNAWGAKVLAALKRAES